MRSNYTRLLILALLLSSCRLVGGDSTHAGLAHYAGQPAQLHTQSGCGWTGDNGWPAPCRVPLSEAVGEDIILGVSLWDVFATDLSGYREATDFYVSQGLTVVWSAIPPYGDGELWTQEVIDSHNAAVEAYLGCPLLPPSVRDAETLDGLHYTAAGAAVVNARYSIVDMDAFSCS